MEIKKIICKSGREYSIVNEYWETSRAWGHKSTLVAQCGEIESRKVRYYNRTWESYTYQNCMSGLLDSILENDFKNYITREKENNGIARVTKVKKAELEQKWSNNSYIQDLMEIKERISNRNFD